MNERVATSEVHGAAGTPRPRPLVHFTAPIHWLNDPNGVILRDGIYHMFFQHNPGDPVWAAPHWGHASSPDLVTWTHLPLALSPDSPLDINGCFSGCCVDHGGTPTIIYTAVGSVNGVDDETVRAATSDGNLLHWTKDERPLLTKPPLDPPLTGYRDPHVWRDGDVWRMILGGGSARGGRVLLYESADLREWQYVGLMFDHESSGSPLTEGRMWECPQLIRLGDVDVLLLSILDEAPLHVVMVEGNLIGNRFVPRAASLFDSGSSLYAPYAFRVEDGSHRVIGWLRETEAQLDYELTWSGAMTLPRSINAMLQQVQVTPARERVALRSATLLGPADRMLTGTDDPPMTVSFHGAIEIGASITLGPGQAVTLAVNAQPESTEHFAIEVLGDGIDLHRHRGTSKVTSSAPSRPRLFADRTPRDDALRPSPAGTVIVDLTIVIDRSIIEISTADGRWLTERFRSDPDVGPRHLTVGGSGTARSLTVWSLEVDRRASTGDGIER